MHQVWNVFHYMQHFFVFQELHAAVSPPSTLPFLQMWAAPSWMEGWTLHQQHCVVWVPFTLPLFLVWTHDVPATYYRLGSGTASSPQLSSRCTLHLAVSQPPPHTPSSSDWRAGEQDCVCLTGCWLLLTCYCYTTLRTITCATPVVVWFTYMHANTCIYTTDCVDERVHHHTLAVYSIATKGTYTCTVYIFVHTGYI